MDIIAAYQQVGRIEVPRRSAARPTRPSAGSSNAPRPARPPAGAARPRARNYDAVTELVAERVEKSQGRISAKRLLPIARAAGYEGSPTELPPAGRGAESVVAQGSSPWPAAGGVGTG